ncbi:MAG: hypothetical protein ACJA1B_001958 [Polaribacter sp.]|jgi:hypothetical protein
MSTEIKNAIFNNDLKNIERIVREYGIKSSLIDSSSLIPLSTLILEFSDSKKNKAFNLFLNFIPLEDGLFDDSKLLRLYAELNCKQTNKPNDEVAKLFYEINDSIALGQFTIDPNSKISFRYIYPLMQFDDMDEQKLRIINMIQIFTFILYSYGDIVENYLNGKTTFDEAMQLV